MSTKHITESKYWVFWIQKWTQKRPFITESQQTTGWSIALCDSKLILFYAATEATQHTLIKSVQLICQYEWKNQLKLYSLLLSVNGITETNTITHINIFQLLSYVLQMPYLKKQNFY